MPMRYRRACRAVAKEFKMAPEVLLSPTRGRPEQAVARQAFMYVLQTKYNLSFTEVGRLIGRYRKTVSHGILQTQRRQGASKNFSDRIVKIRAAL